MKLSLELLKERSASLSQEAAEGILESLLRNVSKTYSLVENLLLLAESGLVLGSLDYVDVFDVVTKVLENNDTELNRRGVLVKLDNEMGKVRANATHVYQVFYNLILNAVRHNRSDTPELAVSYLGKSGPGTHRFLVKDNGQGIPAELTDTLFEPFTKGVGGGTGVGLAIVEKVIHIYDGSIKAYNEGGACFEFTLKDYPPAVKRLSSA
jgi:signal transduction histidine kinase